MIRGLVQNLNSDMLFCAVCFNKSSLLRPLHEISLVIEPVLFRILGTLMLSSEPACISTSFEQNCCNQGCVINGGGVAQCTTVDRTDLLQAFVLLLQTYIGRPMDTLFFLCFHTCPLQCCLLYPLFPTCRIFILNAIFLVF